MRIAEQLNDLLNGKEEVPEWLTLGRTILCLKDPSKANAVDNFRPISCLPLMFGIAVPVEEYGRLEDRADNMKTNIRNC